MSFDPHARRFNPPRLFPAIEPDEEETSGAPDEYHFGSDEEATDDPAGQDFDEALEQIASEGCCVCPLCGAIVASDGSVLSRGPSGPISPRRHFPPRIHLNRSHRCTQLRR
jgi:hypothetical protein